jgi:predicted P-loop ATPase
MTTLQYGGTGHQFGSIKHGEFSEDQRDNLEHLAQFLPLWFRWNPNYHLGKAPVSPHSGVIGAVDDSLTAGSLTEVLAKIPDNGGVGVLLSAAPEDLVCLDLDHVIHEGQLHPLGAQAVDLFKGTYFEVSPSGTGIRILGLGSVPWSESEAKIMGPINVGTCPSGAKINFEVYHHQPNKWARCTGAVLEGTAGRITAAQEGIDWVIAKMSGASKKTGPGSSIVNVKNLGIDEVFAQLETLRGSPDVDSDEVIAEIESHVIHKPRSKLAGAWRGAGDWSGADYAVCCEAIRRGAGSLEAVVEVWMAAPTSDRKKFDRHDYQQSTVERAARAVLNDPPKNWNAEDDSVPVRVTPELEQALAASGDALVFVKSGELASVVCNAVVLFRNDPALLGCVGYNQMTQKAVRLKPWTIFDRGGNSVAGNLEDDDLTRVSMWLTKQYGMKLKPAEVTQGLEAAARDASFDPLADKLRELTWDGVVRVPTWLKKYAKVDDTGAEAYVAAAGQCFLVGAVARAMDPGCKHDTVLVLEGDGGGGKSTLFRVLADAIAPDLFTDAVRDISNTADLVESAGGCWIVEIAELSGIRRASDVEALKAAITRSADKFRRPYDRLEKLIPRRFVFAATTNQAEYLNDPSGALLRRFWPVRTKATESKQIDRTALAAIAPQLWAEAVTLYDAGAKWFISEPDGVAYEQWLHGRDARREDGAFHDEAIPVLMEWASDYVVDRKGQSLKDIAVKVGDLRTQDGDQKSRMALGGTLRSLGLHKRKTRVGTNEWHFSEDSLRDFIQRRQVSPRG